MNPATERSLFKGSIISIRGMEMCSKKKMNGKEERKRRMGRDVFLAGWD